MPMAMEESCQAAPSFYNPIDGCAYENGAIDFLTKSKSGLDMCHLTI